MSSSLAKITRGSELTLEVVLTALESRVRAAALFAHLATIAKPKQGAAKVLVLLSRLADVAWVDGDLRVELVVDRGGTFIDVLADAGGLRERVFRRARFEAPMSEFVAAVERFPRAVEPLTLRTLSDRSAVLVSATATSTTSVIPRDIEIDAESVKRTSAPPPAETTPRALPNTAPRMEAPRKISERAPVARMQTVSFDARAVAREAERVKKALSIHPGRTQTTRYEASAVEREVARLRATSSSAEREPIAEEPPKATEKTKRPTFRPLSTKQSLRPSRGSMRPKRDDEDLDEGWD